MMSLWILRKDLNGNISETKFFEFNQANKAFRESIKPDVEEVSEMLFAYGCQDEESQKLYSRVSEFLNQFVSDNKFPHDADFETVSCDDNFYNIIINFINKSNGSIAASSV